MGSERDILDITPAAWPGRGFVVQEGGGQVWLGGGRGSAHWEEVELVVAPLWHPPSSGVIHITGHFLVFMSPTFLNHLPNFIPTDVLHLCFIFLLCFSDRFLFSTVCMDIFYGVHALSLKLWRNYVLFSHQSTTNSFTYRQKQKWTGIWNRFYLCFI